MKCTLKLVAITLCLSLSLAFLGGCTGTKKPSDTANPSDTVKVDNTSKQSDPVRWINATYAVLTKSNKGDLDAVGGYKKDKSNEVALKMVLERDWGVTDRKTADENMDWVLSEGHRTNYNEIAASLAEEGIFELTKEELEYGLAEETDKALVNMYWIFWNANKDFAEHPIDAWDYSRAIQLCGMYYIAGYYTEAEALDKSLEIAKELQTLYTSWDDMMKSYMYGYQYWQEDDINDPTSASFARNKLYQDLKASDESPYTVDWNTTLEKTW